MEVMRCVWCEKETTKNRDFLNENLKFANKEHVFPESIGGNRSLKVGLVCEECNHKLGTSVDDKLKYSSPIFMNLYQKSSIIQGKPYGKKRKNKAQIRKEEEVYKIENKSSNLVIERNKLNINETTLTNYCFVNDENIYNAWLSLGIHKCAFNSILELKGYEYVINNHLDLRKFVLNGSDKIKDNEEIEDCEEWSYAVCYANNESFVKFEPFCFPILNEDHSKIVAVLLFFSTAIFIVGLQSNFLSAINLSNVVNILPDFGTMLNINGFEYKSHYKKSFKIIGLSKEPFLNPINELEFEIFTKPKLFHTEDKNNYNILTVCKFCRNITTINLRISKSIIDDFNMSNFLTNSSCIHCNSSINSKEHKLFVKKTV